MNKIVVDRDTMHWYGEPPCIPCGQQLFSQFEFSLSEDWDNANILAQFKQGDTLLNVGVTENTCYVPYELNPGTAYLRLKGTFERNSEVIATANELQFSLVQGFEPGGSPSVPPTPDLYQSLLSKIQTQIGDLSDLTTDDKENLVAAINEVAKTGSGGVGSISMQTADGYIQYSTDNGKSWKNLIALDELKGEPGQDGAPGKDGEPGKDGTPGKDGVTPHIGDNGNWYIGSTDTGKPSRGATGANGPAGAQGEKGDTGPQGPAGTPGKDGAGMDITGATVGQIAKIAAVDESGVPTAWEPVDMPGGGGAWEKIIDTEVMEATPRFTCNGLNCNEIYIKYSKMENATNINSVQDLYLNDTLIMSAATIVNKSGGGVYGWTLCRNNGIVWVVTKSNGAISESNLTPGLVYAQYNLISGVGTATTLKLETPDSTYAPITGKLEVWVR